MSWWRMSLIVLVFVFYSVLELIWTLREQRRGVPLRTGILRSAAMLFFFTAAMGLLAGLRPWLAVGGGAVLAALFPLQVAVVAACRKRTKPLR